MSVKSTYGISREVVIQVITYSLFRATHDQLSQMLETLPESTFRNYAIDSTGCSDEDDSMINSLEEFFSGK